MKGRIRTLEELDADCLPDAPDRFKAALRALLTERDGVRPESRPADGSGRSLRRTSGGDRRPETAPA